MSIGEHFCVNCLVLKLHLSLEEGDTQVILREWVHFLALLVVTNQSTVLLLCCSASPQKVGLRAELSKKVKF